MNKKINVDLSPIRGLLDRVGGQEDPVTFGKLEDRLINTGFVEFGPEDFRKIEVVNGLLSWEGAQISLYIYQPHNSYHQLMSLKKSEEGPKFHLTDCKTLQGMREEGRFDRYVAHRMPSESFPIRYKLIPRSEWSEEDIYVNLWACQNCLDNLDFVKNDKNIKNFDRVTFFEKNKSYFHYPPKYSRSTYPVGGYPSDWRDIAYKLKEKNDWRCDCCQVNLSAQEHRRLLHAHHKNGILRDCEESNLRPLCSLCHSGQPRHSRITTKGDEALVKKIREDQNLEIICPHCRRRIRPASPFRFNR